MSNVKDSWDNFTSELQRVCEHGSKKPEYYRAVRTVFDQIQQLALYDDCPSKAKVDLVHYTTWSNALNMFKTLKITDQVESRTESGCLPMLRMYNYEQSNDPDEGRIKPPALEKIEKRIISFAKSLNSLKYDNLWVERIASGTDIYGCSFSSGPSGIEDDLTYWRLYGNNGNGCSLKVSNTFQGGIYRVRYRERNEGDTKEDKQVADRLNRLLSICKTVVNDAPERYKGVVGGPVVEVLLRIIQSYYHLIKHVAYEGEREWRVISVMPEPNSVRFDISSGNIIKRYVEGTALKEVLSSASVITVGPAVPNRRAARAYIEYMANDIHEIRYVTVKNSKQTYRPTL